MAASTPHKSTAVRSFEQRLTRLRRVFSTLEWVAPRTGGRLALRMWCTPPPAHVRARTVDPGKVFTISASGGRVVAEAWGSGPVVYLMHGWGGARTQLDAYVRPLVDAGHRVVSFDALAHGESPAGPLGGRRGTLPEFIDVLRYVVRDAGPAHGVVAHSMGGTAAALAVLDGLTVGRLVLIAPLADTQPHADRFVEMLGLGKRSRAAFLEQLEAVAGRPLSELSIPSRAASAPGLPPLLVVHDRLDKEVDHAAGALVAASWPGELASTERLGHRRILRDSEVIGRVVEFIRKASLAGDASHS